MFEKVQGTIFLNPEVYRWLEKEAQERGCNIEFVISCLLNKAYVNREAQDA